MGRGKIEIKRIENVNNRVVTFSKRRNGLVKKAKEITVLCDAKVALIVFASNGKMTDYCCPSMDLGAMLDQYQKLSGKKLWDAKHENLSNEIDKIKKENDSLQLELSMNDKMHKNCDQYRHLKGEDIQSLNLKNLMAVEHAVEHGLDKVRDHQMEYLMTKRRNEKMMVEENRQLSFQLQQQEMEIASNARGMMMRDHDAQFGYRVQPIQPNLQEKIMSLVID
ncbi:floral homeotic protein PISTILLATA-like isoform X1 [Brassica napus]|nr:floral homeotic protein PISTILLATA-like isoform X1 [Brassica napus]